MSSSPYKKMGEPNLTSLHGYPRYDGIEYDREVPDHMVVSSPGGVADIYHHWTKGMYSHAVDGTDIYGHTAQNQYPYGAYGSLYRPGHDPSVAYNANLPYDPQYWKNQAPPPPSSDFELIEPADLEVPVEKFNLEGKEQKGSNSNSVQVQVNINPWILFIVLIFAYLALDFWAEAGHKFLAQYLHYSESISWKMMAAYALLMTGVLALVAWLLSVPINTVEQG